MLPTIDQNAYTCMYTLKYIMERGEEWRMWREGSGGCGERGRVEGG